MKQIQLGIAERIEERRQAASYYREAAIAADQDFMRSVREKTRKSVQKRRGIDHARKRWDSHVRLVRQQAHALREAPEGSIEWKYRQELLDSVDDAPQ